jgi:hypothetical protein
MLGSKTSYQHYLARGCPQWGVLPWNLVAGELSWELYGNDYYTTGYAYDLTILINVKFPETVSKVLQTALGIVQRWCDKTNLSTNLNTIVIMPFTRKRDIRGIKQPTLFSKTIRLNS